MSVTISTQKNSFVYCGFQETESLQAGRAQRWHGRAKASAIRDKLAGKETPALSQSEQS
jgi:hypothetical protein